MRVAMIGQKGVPATFGGIERHVEELGSGLVARGHEVTVFSRRSYRAASGDVHRGMRIVTLPSIKTKHLDAISHSAASTIAAMAEGFDVFHFHALGPGLCAPLPRWLSKRAVVQTIHGLDDQRAKWGRGARQVLRAGAWMSERVPHATIVVSRALQDHYRARGSTTFHISNGVSPPNGRAPSSVLDRLGLTKGRYVLFVGRFVPEKAPDLLVRAFAGVEEEGQLVLVGGSSFSEEYAASVRDMAEADRRVVLAGYLYGDELAHLYANAAVFALPSLLEGLPLSLLEAASHGVPVVASAIPPHVEVLGADGPGRRLVTPGSEAELREALGRALAEQDVERHGAATLRDEVLADYRWDEVVASTERVYEYAVASAGP